MTYKIWQSKLIFFKLFIYELLSPVASTFVLLLKISLAHLVYSRTIRENKTTTPYTVSKLYLV